MSESPERREIDLHRRVVVLRPDNIDIRPARSAAIAPLVGFLLGVLAFVAVLFWLESLPFALTLLLMGGAILLVPFSGMGFVYSVYGATVVIDKAKQTAVWQQGWMGMGVGTQELVPFAKIEQVELEEMGREQQAGVADDFAQFELRLRKKSGKVVALGQVTVPRDMESEGRSRIRDVGDAVAALVERPLEVIGEEGGPKRRYRRREPSAVG